jgi:hypothetical protein
MKIIYDTKSPRGRNFICRVLSERRFPSGPEVFTGMVQHRREIGAGAYKSGSEARPLQPIRTGLGSYRLVIDIRSNIFLCYSSIIPKSSSNVK